MTTQFECPKHGAMKPGQILHNGHTYTCSTCGQGLRANSEDTRDAEIVRLRAERDEAFAHGKQAFDELRRVEAENAALAAHVEALQEKQKAETCSCSHDNATDVCVGHSPMLRKTKAERDALATHVEEARSRIKDWRNGEMGDTAAAMTLEDWRVSTPETSLAQRDARMKVDVLTAVIEEAPLTHADMLAWIDERAAELRRQAEESSQ